MIPRVLVYFHIYIYIIMQDFYQKQQPCQDRPGYTLAESVEEADLALRLGNGAGKCCVCQGFLF